MSKTRDIRKVTESQPTIEGAGVHLKRAFGFGDVSGYDPFLLLDDFRSDDPRRYVKGFPWHPHRGIETITYVLCGDVEHGDSMGNKGVIGSGDVQWMTAGSGIIHQEMPRGDHRGAMQGFQLWANLPSTHKMKNPRYQEVKSNWIPEVPSGEGTKIRIICGEVKGTKGPVEGIVIDPEYLDVTISSDSTFIHPTRRGHTVLAYVIEGNACFDAKKNTLVSNEHLVIFDEGEQVTVSTEADPVRFLLISGKPIGEPIAWWGPIVMNTQEELQIALEEYRNGTFIKPASVG